MDKGTLWNADSVDCYSGRSWRFDQTESLEGSYWVSRGCFQESLSVSCLAHLVAGGCTFIKMKAV